jgi:hypothetical protein
VGLVVVLTVDVATSGTRGVRRQEDSGVVPGEDPQVGPCRLA